MTEVEASVTTKWDQLIPAHPKHIIDTGFPPDEIVYSRGRGDLQPTGIASGVGAFRA